MKTISKYIASVIGGLVSAKSIADYLSSNGRKTSSNTVDDYVEALVESYLFYSAKRYDIAGELLLERNRKMYIVDLGLRNYLARKKGSDIGYSIENIVYFELLRQGFKVNIGKVGATEVDFVAEKANETEHYHVTASMLEESTFNREILPLKNIKDFYPEETINS